MDTMTIRMAGKLKEIRKQRGLSLEQVSGLTTISKSMLSQLERAEVSPTISTVNKIASGLKVPFSTFITEEQQMFVKVTKEGQDLILGEDNCRLYSVFKMSEECNLEIHTLELDVEGVHEPTERIPGTRIFLNIKEGKIVVELKDHTYELLMGESASFDGYEEYRIRNVGTEMAKADIVLYYAR